MRWIGIVVVLCIVGCDDAPVATVKPVAPPASTQPDLPVIVVDRAHVVSEKGNGRPYVVPAGRGIVLDARKFRLDDPKGLVRQPNKVQLIYNKSMYGAAWPARGEQTATLTTETLAVAHGEPFTGFDAGTNLYIAIGHEGVDLDHEETRFTPFWVGSVLFK